MNKKREKVKDVVYIVQNDINKNDVTPFTERPILCETMSVITGTEWSKDTLDYHFSKLKEKEFNYRGYTIFMRQMQRGKSRGRFSGADEDDSSAVNTFARDNY